MQVGPICLIVLVAAPGIGASGAVIVLRFFRGATVVFQDCMGSLRHFLCIALVVANCPAVEVLDGVCLFIR